MLVRALTPEDFSALYAGFSRAFADYVVPMRLNASQYRDMLIRRGICYELSFAVFEGSEVVAFSLTGLGLWQGVPTAYDLSTGVRPERRGRGLCRTLFAQMTPRVRGAGARQFLLEVISTNLPALTTYEKLGFRDIRHFDCYRDEAPPPPPAPLPDTIIRVELLPPTWGFDEQRWEAQPSWQNSTASIRRSPERPWVAQAFRGGRLLGYAIAFASTGDVAQIWVEPGVRRQGVGRRLLSALRGHCTPSTLRMLNVDRGRADLRGFLEQLGFTHTVSQKEMLLAL